MGIFSRKKATEVIKEEVKSSNTMIQPLTSEPQFYYTGYSGGSSLTPKYNSDVLLALYETVSQLNCVINYIAQKANEIPYKHYKVDVNGGKKDMGNTEAIKFIDSLDIRGMVIQFLVHGNVFLQKKITPGFKLPTQGVVHPSPRLFAIPQQSIDQYGTPSLTIDVFDNPVVRYSKMLDCGTMKNFAIEEIIHIKDLQANLKGKDYYYGTSRLYAAIDTSNTLKYLAETINTILNAKGALGFISRNTKTGEIDPMMYKDHTDEAKRSINEDYGTTGNRRSIMVTLADLKWNRMDSPMSEFMPVELSAFEFDQICNQMGGVPSILFNAKTNASYNNMREAKASFYTNCLSPLLFHLFTEISKDLKINYSNEWIEPDFSDVEELQKDRQMNAAALKSESEYLSTMIDKKLITKNDFLERMGFQKNNDPAFNTIDQPKEEKEIVEPIIIPKNGNENI
jgi:phage portal protein BeeE